MRSSHHRPERTLSRLAEVAHRHHPSAMKKRPDGPKGYIEEPDPYRTRSRDGKTILCFACGLAASAVKKLRIISCHACNAYFHLECLDPPLVTPPPASAKWVCPLHMDKTLPCGQAPKESTTMVPIDTLHTPNDGNIDVIVTPLNRTKAKQVEEIIINRVKYQVPENIVILDFWAKLGKGHELSKTAILDPPLARDDSSGVPTNRASVSASASSQNAGLVPPTSSSSKDVGLRPSSADSHFPVSSLPPPPPLIPSTISSTNVHTDLSYLLQAAQQVHEEQSSHSEEGLALLGNAASTQSPVALNVCRSHKKKTSPKPGSSTPRTRTRGSARLAKSTSGPTNLDNIQRSNSLEKQSEPTSTTPLAASLTNPEGVDTRKPSTGPSSSSANQLLPLKRSECPTLPVRKRKKRLNTTKTSPSLIQTTNPNISNSPLPEKNATAVDRPPSNAPTRDLTKSLEHVTPSHDLPVGGGAMRSHGTPSRAPNINSPKLPSKLRGSNDQSTKKDTPLSLNSNKQNRTNQMAESTSSRTSLMTSTTAPSTSVQFTPDPPGVPTDQKTSTLSTTRPQAPKGLAVDQPSLIDHFQGQPSSSVFSLLSDNPPSTRGETAPPAKACPVESSNPGASNSKQRTASGQSTQSPLIKKNASASTVSQALSDPKRGSANSEAGSVTRPPRKKVRRNNHQSPVQVINSTPSSKGVGLPLGDSHNSASQAINSTTLSRAAESPTVNNHNAHSQPINCSPLSKASESPTIPKNVPQVPQPVISASTVSQSSSKGSEPLVRKLSVNRGDVPGRTTMNRGQKPGKAALTKTTATSSPALASGLHATTSDSATFVPPKPWDPAMGKVQSTPSLAYDTPISAHETTKNYPPAPGSASDKSFETTQYGQNHVAPHLLPQPTHQPAARPANNVSNTPLLNSPTVTKTKRKKTIKNSSHPPHLANGQTPAEKESSNISRKGTSLAPSDIASGSSALPLDPRLSAPANSGIPKTSKPPPKPSSSVEGPGNHSARLSISLARVENDQSSKSTVSTSPGKPPPRKKVKRKSAPAAISAFSTANHDPVTSKTPPIESSISPSLPSLNPSHIRPATTSFVPHPQNPLTLIPQPQRVTSFVAHPQALAFVPHPQHSPPAFVAPGPQSPYVSYPQYPGTLLKSGTPSFIYGGRPLVHEGSNPSVPPRRGSLTVHGSSPPLNTTAASPTAALPAATESNFVAELSRPPSAVPNTPMPPPRESLFIPLPLTKPVRSTPEPSSWK
ncbi:hypothetical protein PCASD_02604 [Puccinia coronata f. sp. avenae]|uniref:PHD-type domain-containing protein n=1 Tax=Puccinia coronata f. sp. avenae TaxID=200324 RepID=A0A2N5VBD8_9BASI|nr:hypothetical protein PCASD_02604 [Puccinia coronata f. sp. avenae]